MTDSMIIYIHNKQHKQTANTHRILTDTNFLHKRPSWMGNSNLSK